MTAKSNVSTDLLFGALAGIEADALCICGCRAYRHTPCCGSCLDCGDRLCPEFDSTGTM